MTYFDDTMASTCQVGTPEEPTPMPKGYLLRDDFMRCILGFFSFPIPLTSPCDK